VSRCPSHEDNPAFYRFTLRIACLHSTITVFVPLLHFLSNPVYIIDNQLTTWKRILREKLIVPHLIKKFRAFKVKKRGCPSTRHVGSSKNEGITPLIIILGNILSGQLCTKSVFFFRGKLRSLSNRRLVGPQSRYGRFGEEKISCTCQDMNPGSSITPPIYYIDYAIDCHWTAGTQRVGESKVPPAEHILWGSYKRIHSSDSLDVTD
jgi:hypothetical protein